MKPEKFYKAQIIEHVLNKGVLGSGDVLINELTVDGMRNRTDLVLVNGSMHAIEIKTNSDSLNRLGEQIIAFKRHFDKLTVACGQRHLEKLQFDLPEDIGLWLVDEKSKKVKIIRRGRKNEVRDPLDFWSFIPVRDIACFLRDCSIKLHGYLGRKALCDIARKHVPLRKMRQFALQFAKKRYGVKWQKFLEQYERNGVVHPDYIDVFQWERPEPASPQIPYGDFGAYFPSYATMKRQRPIPVMRKKTK